MNRTISAHTRRPSAACLPRRPVRPERPDGIEVVETRDPAERQAAFELANRIYCEEHLGRPWADNRHLFPVDEHFARARIFVARVDGRVVATAWLHDAGPLPIEQHYDLGPARRRGLRLVQGSHAACAPEWRGRGLSRRIWARVRAEAARVGDHLVFISGTAIDDDAAVCAMVAGFDARGEWGWTAAPLPGVRTADAGDARPAPAPWLVEAYRRAFDARPLSRPMYRPQFRQWCLPMVGPLPAPGPFAPAGAMA